MRGSVLRVLNEFYGRSPETLTWESLRRVCRPPTPRMLEIALSYLVQAELVTQIQDKTDKLDPGVTLFKLSHKGLQLLEGLIADAGVEL